MRLTGDGALVLCHDPQLDRTTDGHGLVSAQTLAAIRSCDAGSWFDPAFAGERVPTLDEALSLAAELGLGANIELKADRGREYATGAAVAATLRQRRADAPTVLASSFLLPALAGLREAAPQTPCGILFRVVPNDWAEIASRFGCTAIGTDHRRLRPRRVAAIRAAGYQLAAYTVNDPQRARLLYDWGVTSVFSDAPDILLPAGAGLVRPLAGAAVPGSPAPARQGAIR